MAAWVLLKHELPDGTWHWDWMLDVLGRADGRLLTFRIGAKVGWPPPSGFDAVEIGPHRREYLSYEGPVSGGRGRVTRAGGGECRVWNKTDRVFVVELATAAEGGQPVLGLHGVQIGQEAEGPRWRFDLEFSG